VAAKRDGQELEGEDLREFVLAYARGDVQDYLAAAFLMAAYLKGLSFRETAVLTRAMIASGATVPLSSVSRPKVDKHSTGGVGDGVTLVFAPLAASMGLAVPKLSGRGLGHTGGTLDKLESIPGLRTDLALDELERQVEAVGCAVVAQTRDLVPADGALYALRDATATVSSTELIAASVMSKKLAVGTDLVLLDVKAGGGAFMKTPTEAQELARVCVALAEDWDRPDRAAVTDMSQPLGRGIGNALEVAETVAVLQGKEGGRLRELAVDFAAAAAAELLGEEPDAARSRAEDAIDSGVALEAFQAMVAAQGGDPMVAESPWDVLPQAPVVVEVVSNASGWLAATDAEGLGQAVVALGAGRWIKGAPIDPAVGIEFLPFIGDRLEEGQPVARIHAQDQSGATAIAPRILRALEVSPQPVEPPSLVFGWHGMNGDGPR
jgi:pyrimidine-nucleoside phosphorylase